MYLPAILARSLPSGGQNRRGTGGKVHQEAAFVVVCHNVDLKYAQALALRSRRAYSNGLRVGRIGV